MSRSRTPYFNLDEGTTGDRITLIDEGEILAVAYNSGGRYTITEETGPMTILYRTWALALADQAGIDMLDIWGLERQDEWV